MSDLDDLLARSTRALRDASEPTSDVPLEGVAATTLARIERSTRARRVVKLRRRSVTRWIVMPIAASFLIGAAWASASGRLAGWLHSGTHDDDERAVRPALPASASLEPRQSPSLPLLPAPPSASSVPEPAPVVSAPRKIVAAPVDTDALYRDAHEAHFVRRDPAAALVAWDRYLAAAGPSGRFTLEARYNRAVTLVRLGRREEAASALRPFASGEYGGYRRDEAAQLLRTVE